MAEKSFCEILDEFWSLGIEKQLDYGKFHLYSIVTHSTAIEGSTVTEAENRLLFDEGMGAHRPVSEIFMNLDLKTAYEKAFSLAEDHAPFSVRTLCSLSALVMKNTGSTYRNISGEFSSANGELRLLNVSAGRGGRSYMAWQKVPQKLEEFCFWLNRERELILDGGEIPGKAEKVYELSFLAHFRLAQIHPWADGNGRMSRLVMNMVQKEFSIVPSVVKKESRLQYIESLARAQESEDPSPFVEFMFRHHAENLRQQIQEYRNSLK